MYRNKIIETDNVEEEYGKVCWIFGTGVDYPKRPLSKGHVRGRNYFGAFAVAENKRDPEKSFLELYVHTDLGGNIPQSLVEKFLPMQQMSYVESVKKEARRRLKARRKS